MKAFKVYAQKIPVENGSNYNVDHTSLVYLMGRNSEFVSIVNTSLPEKEAAQ
jgi:protein SCO1